MLIGFVEGTLLRVPLIASYSDMNMYSYYPPNDTKYDELDKEHGKMYSDTDYESLWTMRLQGKIRHCINKYHHDYIMWCGEPVPLTRIVEHGKRIVASSSSGLHLFKLGIPDAPVIDKEKKVSAKTVAIAKGSLERVIHMPLQNNASFDFRGNLLVLQKCNNALQLCNLHTYKLESVVGAPTGLNPLPPDMHVECSAVSVHDQRIVFMHADGSHRILELMDYHKYNNPVSRSKALTDEDRGKTFVEGTTTTKTVKKKKNAQKKKRVAGKKKK